MNTNAIAGTTHPKDQKFFQSDDISRLEKLIDAAPIPTRPMRAADALAALSPALSRARDKGHSLASLVQLCEQQGLRVTERSVGRAISSLRAAKSSKKKQVGHTKATGG